MALLIFILIILGILHFVSEAIILPTLRHRLRYKLFKLRDELRLLKSENNEKIQEETFKTVDFSINTILKHLPYFNLVLMFQANKEFQEDENLKKRIQNKIHLLESCSIPEVKRINQEAFKYAYEAFLINSASWLIYLSPFLILYLIYHSIRHLGVRISQIKIPLSSTIKEITTGLSVISENDFSKFKKPQGDLIADFE